MNSGARALRVFAALLAALLMLQILWEAILAPIRPGAFWLALKALPLAIFWPGVVHERRRAVQWSLLLLPWYIAEGAVRAWSEHGRAALCAAASALLAACALGAGLWWIRSLKQAQRPDAGRDP